MSAGVSIIGQCAECCVCPEATVEWDSRSASLTKCGFSEFSGFVSSPPRLYLRADLDGLFQTSGFSDNIYDSFSEYDGITCDSTGDISGNSPECEFTERSGYGTCDGNTIREVLFFENSFCEGSYFEASYIINSSTSRTWTACSSSSTTGSVTNVLSNEYTTSLLKSNTVATLPDYDNDWNDTAGSYANLTTDEITYSARESRYRLRFKIPIIGFGDCYKVEWVERFTPEGGGAVTDTERCDIWDGTIPSGYDPEDSATWPVLPSAAPYYYELPVPSSDGTTTVVNVVAECVDCSACP